MMSDEVVLCNDNVYQYFGHFFNEDKSFTEYRSTGLYLIGC
jgi:hypothetical protein